MLGVPADPLPSAQPLPPLCPQPCSRTRRRPCNFLIMFISLNNFLLFIFPRLLLIYEKGNDFIDNALSMNLPV